MMTSSQRIKFIEKKLQDAFNPEKLIITDDSAQHIGHAGSKTGAGHFTVTISSESFKNKNRIEIHREIYAELKELIPDEIHALQIKFV